MKMAGQYGNERVTILNLRVVGWSPRRTCCSSAAPFLARKNSLVFVRRAVKKLA